MSLIAITWSFTKSSCETGNSDALAPSAGLGDAEGAGASTFKEGGFVAGEVDATGAAGDPLDPSCSGDEVVTVFEESVEESGAFDETKAGDALGVGGMGSCDGADPLRGG